MRAPGREHATACSTIPRAEAATITRSAPRPSVIERTVLSRHRIARIERRFRAEFERQLAPFRHCIGRHDPGAGARHHHRENQSDGSLAQNHDHIFRLRIQLLDAFEARIHWLDETRLIEGNARREFFRRPARQSSPWRGRIAKIRRPPVHIRPLRRPSYIPGTARTACAGSKNIFRTECDGTRSRGRPARNA